MKELALIALLGGGDLSCGDAYLEKGQEIPPICFWLNILKLEILCMSTILMVPAYISLPDSGQF